MCEFLLLPREPPFHLTRRGWGEFPVRVQVHFKDSQNKRIDIIHNLKVLCVLNVAAHCSLETQCLFSLPEDRDCQWWNQGNPVCVMLTATALSPQSWGGNYSTSRV